MARPRWLDSSRHDASIVTTARHQGIDSALYGITAACLAVLLWLAIAPVQFRFAIPSESFRHDSGFAYVVKAPRPDGLAGLLSFRADRQGSYASRLTVIDNGEPLPWPHERIEDVRDVGAGRYLHWRGHIYVSAPDNSDPRATGRAYTAIAPLSAPWWLEMLGASLAFASIARLLRDRPRERALLRPWVQRSLWSFDIRTGAAGAAVLAAAAIVAGAACMLMMWNSGASTSTSLAAYFPISDGKGHRECAAALIDLGANDKWCHRRPIYSVFLAGLYTAVGRDLGLLYIAQAALVLAACGVLAREVSRWIGLAGAGAFLVAMLLFCWKWIFGQTMTEVFGLTAGLLGQAALLRAAESRSPASAALGVFLISAGLSARPGAVLTLAFVMLWALAQGWPNRRAMIVRGALAVAAAIAGIALHSLCMLVVHGNLGGSFGNFSLTLYGLSVGKGWSAGIADHPELIADNAENYAAFYRLAWENFLSQPAVLLRGLWDNFLVYVISLWNHWLPERNAPFARLLFAVSVAVVAMEARRSRRALLVLVFVLGEAASSLLIARDAEPRVWCATIGLAQIAPLLLALTALGRRYAGVVGAAPPPLLSAAAPLPRGVLVLSALVTFFMSIAAAGAARTPPRAVSAHACPAGMAQHLVTAGARAVVMTIDNSAQPQMWPRRISREALIRGVLSDSGYRRHIHALDAVRLIQADPAYDTAPAALYAPASLKFETGVPTIACVDHAKTIIVADAPYALVVSAAPLR